MTGDLLCNNCFSELSPEQRTDRNALILFSVKDKDLIMSNQYIAEAYVHFLEVPESVEPIRNIPQVHLELHRPKSTGTLFLKVLIK